MLHLDFTDFGQVVSLAGPELPGCPRSVVANKAADVLALFCEKTQCYREHIDMTIDSGAADYELVSPHEDTIIIGLVQLVIDGDLQMPGQYRSDAPNVIELLESQSGDCRATVILRPSHGATTAPASILARWASVIADGVKAKLMLMPGTDWSNPEMAVYYQNSFNRDVLTAAADVRNEFSVSRTGRAPRAMSPYGV